MEEKQTVESQPARRSNITLIILSLLAGAAMLGGAFWYSGRTTRQPAPPLEQPAERAPETRPIPPPPPAAEEKPFFNLGSLPRPPRENKQAFIDFMARERREDPKFLEQRWDRAQAILNVKDIWRDNELEAFLLTPREYFCREWNLPRAYEHNFLDIHYGVTISGPHLVSRMTSSLDVQPGEKVLEIGTGSGHQSAVLSHLTDKVYTIEIIEPLEKETEDLYKYYFLNGYPEFANIHVKADDGYWGWPEHAPFDKIIVTCGIDHIPPELLKQLTTGGVMVIPVGPPGAQIVLKVTKKLDESGNVTVTREDIYEGKKKVPFVPFTKRGGGTWNR